MIYAILILGFLLRLINLNQSLWLDEAITALAVKNNSVIDIITKFSPGDVHPPLHYIFLRIWGDLFGYSEIALRMPSVIFGLIAVYFTYKIGKHSFDERIGTIAALFLAINPLAVYYSQEARMYSLILAAITTAVYFFLVKKWSWFILCFTIAVFSDYLPWIMLPIFFIFSMNRKLFFVYLLLLFVTYLPWLPTFWRQFGANTSLAQSIPAWGQVVGGVDLKTLPLTWVKFIIGRISLTNKWLYGGIMLGITAIYLLILSKIRNRFLWTWLIFPTIALYIISFKIPIFGYHRLLFVIPALMLLLAAGAKQKIYISAVAIISLCSLIIFNTNNSFQRENWREAVKYMETANSLAIMPSLAQNPALIYYRLSTPLVDVSHPINLENVHTVYLIRYVPEIFDPKDIGLQTVENNRYKFKSNRDFNGVAIWTYEKT